MSGARMIFYLKQETPMIHFQWDQDGAIIRGSELKPKLDKFLVRKFGRAKLKKWIMHEEDDTGQIALDYKVRIQADSKLKKDFPKNGMYFGNMGKKQDEEIKYVFYEEPIRLEVICLYEELRKKIKESLPEFFVVSNFGTRQDKGYGGFSYIKKKGETLNEKCTHKDICKILSEYYGAKATYYFDIEQNGDPYVYLDQIKNIYSLMKSGINLTVPFRGTKKISISDIMKEWEDDISIRRKNKSFKGKEILMLNVNRNDKEKLEKKYKKMGAYIVFPKWFCKEEDGSFTYQLMRQTYERSLLFRYIHENDFDLIDEKESLKSKKIAPVKKTSPMASNGRREAINDSQVRYVRGVVGIAEKMSYLPERGKDRIDISNKCRDKSIERAQSPILFKKVGQKVFFVMGRFDKNLLGKEFVFKNKDGKSMTAIVPTRGEIGDDFEDNFMSYCYQKFKGERLLSKFYPTVANIEEVTKSE